MTLTLTANINATTRRLRVTGSVTGIQPGYAFRLDDELLTLQGLVSDRGRYQDPNDWYVNRGQDGSTAASHTAGAAILGAVDAFASAESGTTPPSPWSGGGDGGGPVAFTERVLSADVVIPENKGAVFVGPLELNGHTIDSSASGAAFAIVDGLGGIASPLAIADCALWLDASTLDLADDDQVATWPDGSGNGYDAVGVPQDTIQTLDVTGATSGAYALGIPVDGGSSEVIGWNEPASEVQTALQLMPEIGSGNAIVTLDGQVYTITLSTDRLIAALVATPIDLNVTPVVTVTQRGYGTANRPICKTAIQNGLRVVRFDSDPELNGQRPQFLELTGDGLSLLNAAPGVTVCAVVRNRNDGWGINAILNALLPDASNSRLQLYFDTAVWDAQVAVNFADDASAWFNSQLLQNDSSWRGSFALLGAVDLTSGPRGVIATSDSGSASTGGTPGGPSSSWTTGSIPDTACAGVMIGGDNVLQGNAIADADLCEIVVYTRHLTFKERRLLMDYLSDKWGTL